MYMRRTWLLLLSASLVFCGDDRRDGGCRLRQIVHYRLGPFECDRDKECPRGYRCIDQPGDGQHKRFCLSLGPRQEQCQGNRDCPAGLVCAASVWAVEHERSCIQACEGKNACRDQGLCQPRGGKCAALQDTDCPLCQYDLDTCPG